MEDGEKKFAQAGHLKPGSFVLIDGEPCQVKSKEKSKPGKHGAAKVRVTAMSLFKDTKKNLMKPTDADVEVPIVERRNGQIVAVMGDLVQIMDLDNYETKDVPKPKDIQGLQGGAEIEYIKWGGQIKIIRKKN
jgi:translation initiation factor 5A